MENQRESVEDILQWKNVKNLLLMAVLGDDSIRQKACQELQRRRIINQQDDFEDSFMTNLSVV